MDVLDIFDFFGDLTGCCLLSLAVLLVLLACSACVVGLFLIGVLG